ncbi:pre-mRNA-splicing factor CWC22 homolog [Cydia fagiglandana]|uniref:pre-mRNA-splicing factor CWC22 homolog n=1 Tax=Cydia fagiglandana TaxID=1458189 RepID=UPI002FEE5262
MDFTNMSTNADADDEYLDDPITLLNIEDIKTEILDEDQIINVSSDEEETYTSAYGKKNFVLPVTFFDISRNVKLLNKCKPLSIRIVDCKQHPTYYNKEQDKCENKSDESCIEENKCNTNSETKSNNVNAEGENKCNTDSETKSNNVNAEGIVNIPHTTENVGEKSIKEREKKRQSDSFYEKLKKRKEERKRIALNCKDLSRVDFKRNTGLVGLKITDTIFRQIVDTEYALINAKCSSVETKSKDKNQNYAEKPSITSKNITSDNKCIEQHNSVVEKELDMENFISNEKKCAEINEKRGSGKKLLYTKTISSDDNSRGNMANAMENPPIKQSTYVENKSNDKNESDIQKEYIVPKSLDTDKIKTKKKSETIADKEIKTNTKSVVKCKEKMTENVEKALIRNRCNPKEEKSKDDKGKDPIKSTSSKQENSNVTKQVDKVVVKDASREQAGPNSPVIPCTTITIRAATPKSAPKETSAKISISTNSDWTETNTISLPTADSTATSTTDAP